MSWLKGILRSKDIEAVKRGNHTPKEKIIYTIMGIEGGYVDDPADSGGKTNWGITENIAREYGYTGHMKALSYDLAFTIYEEMFWDAIKGDGIASLSEQLAREIMDTAVNQGVGRAGTFLQRSLNVLNNNQRHYNDVVVDGHIGASTIEALRLYLKLRGSKGEKVLYNMLNCLQGAFYVTLAERRQKDERFVYGWYEHRITIA